MRCRVVVTAAGVLLLLAGCEPTAFPGSGGGGGAGGPSQQDPNGTTRTTDKLSANGLMLHAQLLARLSAAPISLDGAVMHARLNSSGSGGLEQSEEGLELLKYVATCALPQGSSLVANGREFPGNLGLAPEWARQGCSESCQRWVSACLLAHANAYGNSVIISVRGDHPALRTNVSIANFNVQEAAFYGNAFGTANATGLNACWGEGIGNAGNQFLSGRLCGLPGAIGCPVTSQGPCWIPGAVELGFSTCSTNLGAGGYADCGTGVGSPGFAQPGSGPRFHEVITVYRQQ